MGFSGTATFFHEKLGLIGYLDVVTTSLFKVAPRNIREPQTARLSAVVLFIANQQKLVSHENLAIFLQRIAELPGRDATVETLREGAPGIALEYEEYQRKFGRPLLSDKEHSFFVALMRCFEGSTQFHTEAIRAARYVRELRAAVGREFSGSEQSDLLALQNNPSGGTQYGLKEIFWKIIRNHPKLLVQRLPLVRQAVLAHGVSAPEAIEALGKYLGGMDEAMIPEDLQKQKLGCLASFMGKRKRGSFPSCFLQAVVAHDRTLGFNLSHKDLEHYGEIALGLVDLADGKSRLLDMLVKFEGNPLRPLMGGRLDAVGKLVENDGKAYGRPDLCEKLCDWEKERGNALTVTQLDALNSLYQPRSAANNSSLALSMSDVGLIFTYLKKYHPDLETTIVSDLRDQWLDLKSQGYNTSGFSSYATCPKAVHFLDSLNFSDLLQAVKLLGNQSEELDECAEALLHYAVNEKAKFRALDFAKFDVRKT